MHLQEQRATRRFALNLPVAVRFHDSTITELPATTKDVSARGVYLYLDARIDPGSQLEFTMTLPTEITMTEEIRVRCKGIVIRVEDANGKIGIAASIERYEFLAQA